MTDMDWRTQLLDTTPQSRRDYRSLATPVYRGSTVVFDQQSEVSDDWQQEKNGYDNTTLIWCERPGSVSVNDENAYNAMGEVYRQLGLAVSPDDCNLALRGLQTLPVRLDQLETSTLKVAQEKTMAVGWLG